MKTEKLSARQLSVCAFTGGLAPAAACAGYGWQGPLLAVPVILLLGWGLTVLAPRWGEVEDKWTGRAVSILLALAGVVLLARGLARCALRLLRTGGGEEKYAVWMVILLTLPLLWMGRGKPAAFFRAVEIFYLAVTLTGAALLVWGAFHMEWRYVPLPAPDLWGGFWAAMETGAAFLFLLPYGGRVNPEDGPGCVMGWLAALCAAPVLMALVTVGVLSPAVAADAPDPFFLMTATLGRAVRVEGLASALWLLADLSYLGLLSRSWQRSSMGKSWLPCLAAALGAAGAVLSALNPV